MAFEVMTIVLDSGPLIKNEPPISSLLNRATKLITLPVIVNQEIRDQATRSRLQTTVLPFLELRSPSPQHLRAVSYFAKKTGDAAVLSKVDLELLALTREVECELNGGDWRIRKTPGEKLASRLQAKNSDELANGNEIAEDLTQVPSQIDDQNKAAAPAETTEALAHLQLRDDDQQLTKHDPQTTASSTTVDHTEQDYGSHSDSGSDSDTAASEGWITPSNLFKHQALHIAPQSSPKTPVQTKLQCCLITSDFAVQNTALQMNLNLLSASSSLTRIQHLRTYILRCHACFRTCKDTSRQFCPSCGGATLTRVTCTTDAKGNFKLHLKKNMQWNTRGDRYSIPKPVSGSASCKMSVNRAGRKGGGKDGWGKELIFSEDQKEYERAMGQKGRRKEKDLMDDDFLPAILSGDRSRTSQGRPRIGAGRNVNAKRW